MQTHTSTGAITSPDTTLSQRARQVLRRSARILGSRVLQYGAVMALAPIAFGVVNLGSKFANQPHAYNPPSQAAYASVSPVRPADDPSKKTVVVLSSAHGAEITDFLPPYEILSTSGKFNTLALAPERKPLPLVNGNMAATSLEFMPHYSFEEYRREVGRKPDLIAVPWFPNYTPERDAAVIAWIRENAGPETLLLTICAGTEILADTGLLEGRTATTNVGWFRELEGRFPSTRWVRNVRYFDDGRAITSTNLASGIDASLRAVERLSDRATALQVADTLGYRHTQYLDDPASQPPALMSNFLGAALPAAMLPGRPEVGVLAYNGMSELAVAGLLDLNTASSNASMYVIGEERRPVTSQHALTFLPRWGIVDAPHVDRVVVSAGRGGSERERVVSAWEQQRDTRVERIHEGVGAGISANDLTLRDIAQRTGAASADAIGQVMFYQTSQIDFGTRALSFPVVVTAFAVSVLGGGLLFSARRLRRRG